MRPVSPRKILLRNRKEDTYSSVGEREKTKIRIQGVGLAIKTSLCSQLPDLPTPVSERFTKLHFPLNLSRHVTVISAYPPPPPPPSSTSTLTSSYEAKDAFYEELDVLVCSSPPPPPPPPPPRPQATSSSCLETYMREWVPTATTGMAY